MMKPRKSSLTLKSFQDIKDLVKTESVSFPNKSPPPQPPVPHENDQEELTPEVEEELFKEAMEGVIPVSGENYVEKNVEVGFPESSRKKEDLETLLKLEELVRRGTGFNVCDTPEYVEGTGYHVHREIARRLHRGEYSIQAYIDLHGFTVEEAKEEFEKFMKGAVTTDKTGVLIVHGRGLSSPAEPVLKKNVIEWLTRGPWRKWTMAYCSARICDGGAGATYVLLRKRAVSKRFKRSGQLHPGERAKDT